MKILFIAVLIIYFISIYPSYYLWKNIIINTLLQMIDEDLLDEDKKAILISRFKKVNIEVAFTPIINTLALIVFTSMSTDAIQRYVFLRLKVMDVDTFVKDMLDEEE